MRFHVTALLVAFLVASLHVQESTGFLGGIGRAFKSVLRKVGRLACQVCPVGCILVPGGVGRVCDIACSAGCRRSKRDLEAVQKGRGRHLTPMPNNWAVYDIDEDDVISPEELASAVGVNKTGSSFRYAFKLADTDGDGFLSRNEFYDGPFVFEMDVEEEEYARCLYLLNEETSATAGHNSTSPAS